MRKVFTKGVVLKMSSRKFTIPPVRLTYVDIQEVMAGQEAVIGELRANIMEDLEVRGDMKDKKLNIFQSTDNVKYFHDLFYIGPIYHRKFLRLNRFN